MEPKLTRETLPSWRRSETHEIVHTVINQLGMPMELPLSVTLSLFPIGSPRAGQIAEVFINTTFADQKTMNAFVAKDVGTLISVAIQSGADLDDLADAMGHAETVLPIKGPIDLPHTIAGTVLRYLATLRAADDGSA